MADLVETVRIYMRDNTKQNTLLNDLEYTEDEIKLAIDLVLSEFNSYPPTTTLTKDTIPLYIILPGIASKLLTSVSVSKLRNQLNYNDGGDHVMIDDTGPQYKQLADAFFDEYKKYMINYKSALNIDLCWGGA